ncbi:MAG: ribosome maturation factor RimP [Calditerrivibrio sp.]|nr:ribosome maturation factor RimP [Calditerrivibrio sp.]
MLGKENNHIVEKVKSFCESISHKFGVDIFDVQFRKEHSGYTLRVFLDKEGLTLDECSAFSKELSKWLDDEDILSFSYNLEVSSPGLNRPIRNLQDFEKYSGRKCKVELLKKDAEGRKHFTGYIKGVDGETVLLDLKKEVVSISYSDIKKANLEFEF